jgi:hypothetical protein
MAGRIANCCSVSLIIRLVFISCILASLLTLGIHAVQARVRKDGGAYTRRNVASAAIPAVVISAFGTAVVWLAIASCAAYGRGVRLRDACMHPLTRKSAQISSEYGRLDEAAGAPASNSDEEMGRIEYGGVGVVQRGLAVRPVSPADEAYHAAPGSSEARFPDCNRYDTTYMAASTDISVKTQ